MWLSVCGSGCVMVVVMVMLLCFIVVMCSCVCLKKCCCLSRCCIGCMVVCVFLSVLKLRMCWFICG